MTIFRYSGEDVLGKVAAVDTTSVTVIVDNIDVLRKMQVNRLVALRSSRAGQHLIGMIHKIIRKSAEPESHGESGGNDEFRENNTVKILLIGTFFDALLNEKNVFRRTLETVPEIDAECYPIEGDKLTRFMRAISFRTEEEGPSLSLGHYTLDEEAVAYLDANKFFQRHAAIVGSPVPENPTRRRDWWSKSPPCRTATPSCSIFTANTRICPMTGSNTTKLPARMTGVAAGPWKTAYCIFPIGCWATKT